jgi:apolipoprotein N-acyltransferase
MRKRPFLLLLSVLSGILLSLSWFWGLTFLIFFAFVPLLVIEEKMSAAPDRKAVLKILLYSWLSFLIWNVAVTWWVVYASPGGACLAFVFNSLFMAIVFTIFSYIRKKIGKDWATWMLIPVWVAWEHGHTLWDLSWSWLNLGNVFAFRHTWVQWYEFTGTSGGTCWILAANITLFRISRHINFNRPYTRMVMKIAGVFLGPLIISYIMLFSEMSQANRQQYPVNVVVAQTNADPYNVKFYLDYKTQFSKMLSLVRGSITQETEYLVLPETFITENIDEETLAQSEEIRMFRDSLMAFFPRLKVVTGGNTYSFYANEKDVTTTARHDKNRGLFYDMFNTAIFISKSKVLVYHKSKLVPGVERMPFPSLLKPLEKLAINMGGTVGSLGTHAQRVVFSDPETRTSIAPVICYESIYADYMTEYIRKGADFIFILTNDGWWEDTPGYKQHLNYARLRAIENRRQVARCANTGISCFIDEFGNISEATEWWKEAVISKNLFKNEDTTFFTRFGDLISYTSVLFTALVLLWSLFPGLKDKLL